MIDRLPEGKTLGWMQAPSSWISSHTVRFIGVVRIVIQDGEGCILIKKGKPLFHYFRHGTIELKGNSARDYFTSHPIIEFNLCKYTPEEFARALNVCNIEENESVIPVRTERTGPADTPHNPPLKTADAAAGISVHTKEIPEPSGSYIRRETVEKTPVVPQPGIPDEPDPSIMPQISNPDGIVAIVVFNDTRILSAMGDTDSAALVQIAKTLYVTAKKTTPLLNKGPFVHITLQIPEGNMIIAPYHDDVICLLTTRAINIGQIRRLVRDLQQSRAL